MKKMALGMYAIDGITSSTLTENNPLWLADSMTTESFVGILPRASSLTEPYEARLSFVGKHGKNFLGGKATGKFDLIFKFE